MAVVVVLVGATAACGAGSPTAHAPTLQQGQIDHFNRTTEAYLSPTDGQGACYLLTIPQTLRDLRHPAGTHLWQVQGVNSVTPAGDYQCQWSSAGRPNGPLFADAVDGTLELSKTNSHLPGETFVRFPETSWYVGYSATVLNHAGTEWRNSPPSSADLQRLVDDVATNLRQRLGPVPPSGYPKPTTVFAGDRVAPPGTKGFLPVG